MILPWGDLDSRYSNAGTPQTVLQMLPEECQQYMNRFVVS